MTFSRLALLAALALPSLLAGCGSDSSIGGSPGAAGSGSAECTPGDTKAAPDGCNTCSCQQNGFFACTELGCTATKCTTADECFPQADLTACQVRACESGVCKLNAVPGCVNPGDCKAGEQKPAPDACNTCTCQPDGTFACTEIACAPKCTSDAECPQPDVLCGSGLCEAGQCTIKVDPNCCEGQTIDCATPPLCAYEGGGCVNGKLTCGTLVCEGPCQPGEQKPAPDGCNTCTCQPDGTFACTEIACAIPCKTAADCPTAPPNGCALAVCEQGICGFSPDPTCPGNPCAPQDAVGFGECDGFFGVAWDGQACVKITGCGCQGSDCKNLNPNQDECQKAHAGCGSTGSCQSDKDCPESCTTCNGTTICAPGDCQLGTCSPPSFPPCAPGVSPGGTCDQPGSTAPASDGCNTCTCEKSFTWSCTEIACPSGCTTSSDCPPIDPAQCVKCPGINYCGQSYCDTLPESGVCVSVPPSCGDSCEPQDIKGVGPCDAFFGVAWNGKSCESVGGCSCQGKDCGQIYQDQATCNAIHQSCVVPF